MWEKACALSREVERLTGTVSSVFLIGAELLFSFLLLTDWITVTNDLRCSPLLRLYPKTQSLLAKNRGTHRSRRENAAEGEKE